ncbi:unnamed protein product [Cylindrotheca closterium]|uniref:Uncharacterized protein n=1 Tax=Cylindrotheca closterium TaxID=2856 RepID=A0AAD2FQ44_9STRA|nr:unnamed protein product [Cylindrotheca closterium]
MEERLLDSSKDAKKHQWKSRKARDRLFWLRRMKQREEARHRRRAQSKGSTGGLQAMQIEEHLPDGTTSLLTITDRRLVEDGCMQENTARCDQTQAPYTTPPMAEPLYSKFTGDSAESNSLALLEGRYMLPDLLDPATASFLSHCRFHKGHFKAATQSPSIAYCDALFRNILLITGFVPLQWQNLMNFAIELPLKRSPETSAYLKCAPSS